MIYTEYLYGTDGQTRTITKEQALDTMKKAGWEMTDIVKDMLDRPNNIYCIDSEIWVKGEDGMVLMAGLYNQTNYNYKYDENGNRTEG